MIARDGLINSQANQFVERCANDGVSLNSLEIQAINFLIKKLIEVNLWNKFTAIYPFVGRSPITHSYNLKNILRHTIRWFNTSSLVHNHLGVTNTGNGYGNTFVAPGLFWDNNIHVSVYSATYYSYLNPYSPVIGSSAPYEHISKWIHTIFLKSPSIYSAWTYSCGPAGAGRAMAGEDAGDFFHAQVFGHIVGTNGKTCYLNGKKFGFEAGPADTAISIPLNPQIQDVIEGTSYAWTQYPFMLFTNKAFGDPSEGYANANLRFASIGLGLNEEENKNYYEIVEEFQRILGRPAGEIKLQPDDIDLPDDAVTTNLKIEKAIRDNGIFNQENILYIIDTKLDIDNFKVTGPRIIFLEDNVNFNFSLISFQELS